MDSLSPEVQQEPRIALTAGSDGLNVIRRIVAEAPSYIQPGGSLLMEIDSRQAEELRDMIRATSPDHLKNCEIIKDLSGRDRILAWRMPSDPSPM